MPFEFECEACGWTGAEPAFDAHLHPWCPRCGRLAEFADIVRARRASS